MRVGETADSEHIVRIDAVPVYIVGIVEAKLNAGVHRGQGSPCQSDRRWSVGSTEIALDRYIFKRLALAERQRRSNVLVIRPGAVLKSRFDGGMTDADSGEISDPGSWPLLVEVGVKAVRRARISADGQSR